MIYFIYIYTHLIFILCMDIVYMYNLASRQRNLQTNTSFTSASSRMSLLPLCAHFTNQTRPINIVLEYYYTDLTYFFTCFYQLQKPCLYSFGYFNISISYVYKYKYDDKVLNYYRMWIHTRNIQNSLHQHFFKESQYSKVKKCIVVYYVTKRFF